MKHAWLVCAVLLASLPDPASADERASLLLVVEKQDSTVAFLDPVNRSTVARVPVGHHPHEIALAPDGATAYVANYGAGDSISVIDVSKRREARRIALAPYRDPHGIQIGTDGRVYVTCGADRAVVVLDAASGRILRAIPTGQETTHMLALVPGKNKLYTANLGSGSATAINVETGKAVAQIATGAGCEGIDVTPDGREVWTANKNCDTITVIDVAADRVRATLRCGRRPIRVKFTPNGRLALVACARSNEVAVFDVARCAEVRRIATGTAPIGTVIDRAGAWAYVANTEADTISVIDLDALKVVGTIPTGHEPDGLGLAGPAPAARESR